MGNKKLLRKLGIAAAVLVVIGAIGYAARNTGDNANDASTASSGVEMVQPSEGGGSGVGVATTANRDALGDIAKSLPPQVNSGVADSASPAGAGSSVAPGTAPQSGSSDLGSTVDRKIVSTASLDMQVDNVGGSFEEVGRIATSAGGFVASSSFTYQGDRQLASVTIRVPSDSYQSVLGSLRKLGVKVDSESSDANDVTEEYTDLASRLRTLEATEQQLLTLLAKADTITDILTVQDRLNSVRSEIEQVKGRQQLLDNLTSLATITVHLQPVVAGSTVDEPDNGVDLNQKISEAWDDSIEFLGEIVGGVLTVVVFAWWVPVLGLPLLLGYKVTRRHHPQVID
jgi:hypothetical protein